MARPVLGRVHEAEAILHELMPQMRGHFSRTRLNPQPLDAFGPLPWDAADLDEWGNPRWLCCEFGARIGIAMDHCRLWFRFDDRRVGLLAQVTVSLRVGRIGGA